MKFRGYEHGIIEHSDLLRNMTIGEKEKPKETEMHEENTHVRRSSRLKDKSKVDYKIMNEGEKPTPLNENSEVAQYMRESGHTREDMEITILGYEENWWKRGVKEAIHIRKLKPTLNKDQGRYNLGQIWTNIIEEDKEKEAAKSSNLIGRNS